MKNKKTKEQVEKMEDQFFYDMIDDLGAAYEEIDRRKKEHNHPAVIHQEDNVIYVDFVTKGEL